MEGQADVAGSMKLPVVHISTEYLYRHNHLQSQLICQSQLIWSRSLIKPLWERWMMRSCCFSEFQGSQSYITAPSVTR
eukprot:scaffold55248_cov65-Attheya_sp.AAC.6